MEKKWLIIIPVIILALVSSLTIFKSPQPLAKTITIGAAADLINSLIWITEAKQFFADENLNIRLKLYPSGKLALRGLLNKEVDLTTTAETPFVFASFNKKNLRLFTTLATADNEAKILARTDHGINQPSDLKGKTIATQKSSAVHFFLARFLTNNFLKSEDVNIVYMKAVELPAALIQGKIDAFSMREPFIQQAKDSLGDKAIELAEPGIYTKTFNLVGYKDFIETDSNNLKNILLALHKTTKFIETNRDESIAIIAQKRSMTVPQVSALWDNFIFDLSLSQSLLTTLEAEARWAITQKFVTNVEYPNYLELIYAQSLTVIKPEAIGIIQ
ncbi:MAG: NrtA/SsuA/CpmA family ABC transporter substrate-binding protein [Candidatus Marithrix sp.]